MAFLGRNVLVLFRLAARDVRARHVCGAVREHECVAGIPAVIIVDTQNIQRCNNVCSLSKITLRDPTTKRAMNNFNK